MQKPEQKKLQRLPQQNQTNSPFNLNFKSALTSHGEGAFCILGKIVRIVYLVEKMDCSREASHRSD